MRTIRALVFGLAVAVALGVSGCIQHELRGTAEPSADGRTYLVVEDDNGGHCGPILVDGYEWPHAIHAAGPITAGVHTIECGAEIGFRVAAGTTFRFNYWGP